MASIDVLETGATFQGFRVGRLIGRGGMGVVYEATQIALGRPVALKVLASHLRDDPHFRERFRREGLAQAALDHPRVVPIYEAGEADGKLYIAMRLVRGATLKRMIGTADLTPARAIDLLAQAADALDAAHAVGLVHRDFKPQNVLVENGDSVYLADFGLTRAAGDEALTAAGQHLGTALYCSPEQVRGEAATARSDVYSLATVLFECLTGAAPYVRESESAVCFAHLYEPPPRASERNAHLPSALDAVLAQGMAKDPSERYGSASELISDAGRALGLGVPEQTRPVPLPRFAIRGRRTRSRQLAAAACASGLLATAGAGFLLGHVQGRGDGDSTGRAAPANVSGRATYAAGLNAALAALDGTRVYERARLARTASSRVRERSAARIGAAYATGADDLRNIHAAPLVAPRHASIIRALDDAARAYAQLSRTVHANQRGRYREAVAAVEAAEEAVDRRLMTLERLGYTVRKQARSGGP